MATNNQYVTLTAAEDELLPSTTTLDPSVVYKLAFIAAALLFILVLLVTWPKRKTKMFIPDSNLWLSVRFAIIVGASPIALALILNQTQIVSKAEKNVAPRNIEIINLSRTSFELHWRTSTPVAGGYRFSQNPTMVPVSGFKIQEPNKPEIVHSYIVKDLEPGTSYYVELFSDGLWYRNQDQPLVITTIKNE